MALVTIQRSPSPSTDPDLDAAESSEDASDGRSQLRKSLSESYFTVKGAALILPHTECTKKSTKKTHGGEIQSHLQAMLHLLRPEDTIKIAVRLEDPSQNHRYMALVSTRGRQDTEESVILGIDCTQAEACIGLVLPMWMGLKIKLGGDGGFSLCTDEQSYLFKPVSVQAMWSAIQSLYKAARMAEDMKYLPEGLTHTWVGYYRSRIDSKDAFRVCQWNVEGVEVFVPSSLLVKANDGETEKIKSTISQTLKEVMLTFDLDEATSVMLRNAVEQRMCISLTEYKSYFDEEVMRIVGQMDKPSKILEFLYLGSEWNASNLEELIDNGIGYILNVTKEIDNFFEGKFQYFTVRVYDNDDSDLLKQWDKTYKFISKARSHHSKVLVHCKMGVSRSAATVMAFLMKDQRMSVDEALQFVKERRNCVHPNSGFMEQLRTYEGILTASNKRDIFRSKSEQSLAEETAREELEPTQGYFLGASLFHMMSHTESQLPPHSYWHLGSEAMPCNEDCCEMVCKGDTYQMDIPPFEKELETVESRSADSVEEISQDAPALSLETAPVSSVLQTISSTIVSSAEILFSSTLTESSKDMTQEGEMMSEAESSAAYSLSEGGAAAGPCRNPASAGALGSRIKPDSSWIKLEVVSMENGDATSGGVMPLTDSSFCEESCPNTLSHYESSKFGQTLTSQWETFRPITCAHSGDHGVVPSVETVQKPLVISSSKVVGQNFTKISAEDSTTSVHFFLGNVQNVLEIKPASQINQHTSAEIQKQETVFSSATSYDISTSQSRSPEIVSLLDDQNVSSEVKPLNIKQISVEQMPQKSVEAGLSEEHLPRSNQCKDETTGKLENSSGKSQDDSGIGRVSPLHRLEPGVRQYLREKIPWKLGKVRKMQEDINKTGQISQEEDMETDESSKGSLRDIATLSAEISCDQGPCMQTSESFSALGITSSNSCLEVSTLEEEKTGNLTVYEKEDIPLTPGTVQRTRQEIEERQRLIYAEADVDKLVTTPSVVRSSSLKQERGTPRSRYTDNRRLTAGPILSTSASGFPADVTQSLGFRQESMHDVCHSGHLPSCHGEEDVKKQHSDSNTLTEDISSVRLSLEEPPVEAGLVRKQKMELKSKRDRDKAQPNAETGPASLTTVSIYQQPGLRLDVKSCTMKSYSLEDRLGNIPPSPTNIHRQQDLIDHQHFISSEDSGPAAIISASLILEEAEEGAECPASVVRYFVSKIEKHAAVTQPVSVLGSELETKVATIPIKEDSCQLRSFLGHALGKASDGTDNNSECSSLLAAVSSTGSSASLSAIKSEVIEGALSDSGLATKCLSKSNNVIGFVKLFSVTDDPSSSLTHTETTSTLEEMKNISLSSPVSCGKESLESVAKSEWSELSQLTFTPGAHRGQSEPTEASVVKNLVGRFEHKSPEMHRASSDLCYDTHLRGRSVHGCTTTALASTAIGTWKEEPLSGARTAASKLAPCLEPSSETDSELWQSQSYLFSLTGIGSTLSSSTSCSVSPLKSFTRKHFSLDSAPKPTAQYKKTALRYFETAVELPDISGAVDAKSFNKRTSLSSSLYSLPTKRLGPIPFSRANSESLECKSWRSVRPKSMDQPASTLLSPSLSQGNSDLGVGVRSNCRFGASSRQTIMEDSLRLVSEEGRKVRKLHGVSHPLTKLSGSSGSQGPFYS